jgi:hypothetical protein
VRALLRGGRVKPNPWPRNPPYRVPFLRHGWWAIAIVEALEAKTGGTD